ncbi:MAG: hypothetical protein WD625_03040 [Balneolales bacterium]
MPAPRLRMFAGPNGSGKSNLIAELQGQHIPLGSVVNADIVLAELQQSGFIDLKRFSLHNITQEDWDETMRETDLKSRVEKGNAELKIRVIENILVSDTENLGSYGAALISDFLRYRLLKKKIAFSFETVMSHVSKVNFLKQAKEAGYITYLYYMATEDEYINVKRVENRVNQGGHPVSREKIITRYHRSLNLLLDALREADRAYIFDNSKKRNFVILEKKYDGIGYPQVNTYPLWFKKYVVNKAL